MRSSSVLCWPERVTKVDCNEEWTWDLSAQSNLKKIGSITKLFSHQFGIVVYINSIFCMNFLFLRKWNFLYIWTVFCAENKSKSLHISVTMKQIQEKWTTFLFFNKLKLFPWIKIKASELRRLILFICLSFLSHLSN